MAQLLQVAATVSNPALRNISGYAPAIGVPGYTRRFRASKAGYASGATPTSWKSDINATDLLAAAGIPAVSTVNGRLTMDCATGAQTYFQDANAGYHASTLAVVFEQKGTTQSYTIGTMAGRCIQRSSTSWQLIKCTLGSPTNLLTIPFTAVANGARRFVIIAAVSADGLTDTLYVKGAAASTATGPCDLGGTTNQQLIAAIGKNPVASSNGTADGPQFLEGIIWPFQLNTTQIGLVSAYAASAYAIS